MYADRHFLRDGAPEEPAEYRPYTVPLADGQLFTQVAWSDLDAFDASTLSAYPSLVTRNSPVASRPPSLYSARWRGATTRCGSVPRLRPARCSITSRSVTAPRCHSAVNRPRRTGACAPSRRRPASPARWSGGSPAERGWQAAHLVAYERPPPIVARADQAQWPGAWVHDPAARTLPRPGRAHGGRGRAEPAQRLRRYGLADRSPAGSSSRVDGRPVGRVKDELSNIGQYVQVAELATRARRPHRRAALPAGRADLRIGGELTELSAVVLRAARSPDTADARRAPRAGRDAVRSLARLDRGRVGPRALSHADNRLPAAIPWIQSALLAQLVEHFHGKEGVSGSSPEEGLNKLPANRTVRGVRCKSRQRRDRWICLLPSAQHCPIELLGPTPVARGS